MHVPRLRTGDFVWPRRKLGGARKKDRNIRKTEPKRRGSRFGPAQGSASWVRETQRGLVGNSPMATKVGRANTSPSSCSIHVLHYFCVLSLCCNLPEPIACWQFSSGDICNIQAVRGKEKKKRALQETTTTTEKKKKLETNENAGLTKKRLRDYRFPHQPWSNPPHSIRTWALCGFWYEVAAQQSISPTANCRLMDDVPRPYELTAASQDSPQPTLFAPHLLLRGYCAPAPLPPPSAPPPLPQPSCTTLRKSRAHFVSALFLGSLHVPHHVLVRKS